MGKKVEKEKNELVEEFFRKNAPNNIKSKSNMWGAQKYFFVFTIELKRKFLKIYSIYTTNDPQMFLLL